MAGREQGRGQRPDPAGGDWRVAASGGAARALGRRRFLGGLAAAAGAGLLVACGGNDGKSGSNTTPGSGSPAAGNAPSGPAPKGGTLTQAQVGTDAKSFHPFLTTDTASSGYQGYIFGGGSLTKYDPKTIELVADVAEKWEVSSDKKTYTFTLRDTKWSDGAPMTSADYLWTFEQARKPENKYPYAQNLKDIKSYVAKDPRTLVVELNEATVVGLSTADAITPLPKHIWEKYDWNDPAKNPEINAPTVGNGPWKLKEWKRDQLATFVANDLYWEGRPNIDTMVVRNFGTQQLAYQALKAGEIDWSGFQPSDYKEAKTLANINVYEYYLARGSWNYIGFNLRRPWLKDATVRKAIAHATDRKGIIDKVRFGLARPTYSAYPPSSAVYEQNVEKYDFSVQKAGDLLKQAGYTLDSRKKLVKGGEQLKLKMLLPTASPVAEQIATVMQQQLQDLGIELELQALEFQALLEVQKKEPFDWDLFLGGWASTTEPYFAYQIWTEESIPALNAGAYVNKEVERLYEQAKVEFDAEKRKGLYSRIQKLITDDAPYVFLYESLSYSGVNKKVGGIEPTRLGISYNLHKWFINK